MASEECLRPEYIRPDINAPYSPGIIAKKLYKPGNKSSKADFWYIVSLHHAKQIQKVPQVSNACFFRYDASNMARAQV